MKKNYRVCVLIFSLWSLTSYGQGDNRQTSGFYRNSKDPRGPLSRKPTQDSQDYFIIGDIDKIPSQKDDFDPPVKKIPTRSTKKYLGKKEKQQDSSPVGSAYHRFDGLEVSSGDVPEREAFTEMHSQDAIFDSTLLLDPYYQDSWLLLEREPGDL